MRWAPGAVSRWESRRPRGRSVASLQDLRYALRERLARWFERPAVAVLGAIGFTPGRATLAGVALGVAAGYFAATGEFVAAGLLVIGSGVFDMLDGGLARRSGTVSRRGALLDSVGDRVSEGAVLLGLLVYYTDPDTSDRAPAILAFVAFAGSMMVSYVRARAEGLGLKGTAGFATRTERWAVTVVGLLTGWVEPALWVLAVATPLSALQRFWAEWRRHDS